VSVIQTCFAAVIFRLWQYNNIIINIFMCHLFFCITFASFFFRVFKNIYFSYKFTCYSWNCNHSFFYHYLFLYFLMYWVIYTYLDTLLWLLYLVLISILQESKKGETRGKRRSKHIWMKSLYLSETWDEYNMWGSGCGIYISCQLTNFQIQKCRRQATTWHHIEETMKL
jgi:hypothetical protein